jgi:hypothetical protein
MCLSAFARFLVGVLLCLPPSYRFFLLPHIHTPCFTAPTAATHYRCIMLPAPSDACELGHGAVHIHTHEGCDRVCTPLGEGPGTPTVHTAQVHLCRAFYARVLQKPPIRRTFSEDLTSVRHVLQADLNSREAPPPEAPKIMMGPAPGASLPPPIGQPRPVVLPPPPVRPAVAPTPLDKQQELKQQASAHLQARLAQQQQQVLLLILFWSSPAPPLVEFLLVLGFHFEFRLFCWCCFPHEPGLDNGWAVCPNNANTVQ